MSDEEFTITPFDPARGIFFKYGRLYRNRKREIAAFEKAVGYKLPPDFLEMIDDYCEGGFDGHYRVYFKSGVEVAWTHLLLMNLADEHDDPKYDAAGLLGTHTQLFGSDGRVKKFPFGEAFVIRSRTDGSKGYLAFDTQRSDSIVFVPEDGSKPIDIAPTFRDMMHGSSFVFFG